MGPWQPEELVLRKMRFTPHTRSLPALAIFAGLVFASTTAASEPSIVAAVEEKPINVTISFGAEVPLPDLSEESLTAVQKAGRGYAYRLVREECALLTATIAKTCRLIDISTLSDLTQQYYSTLPQLYINGHANFVIYLKDASVSGE